MYLFPLFAYSFSMKVLLYLSEFIVPLVAFFIIVYGLIRKNKVYESFIDGARDGLKTVAQILPTLIGLMVGVKVLRASGFLDWFAGLAGQLTQKIGVPASVVPIIIVRLFSSSAATGLCLDVFQNYGTDSYAGFLTSVLMSCTETVFYTMSVYYMAAKVTKTRWTLAGALISTGAGVVASVILSIIK